MTSILEKAKIVPLSLGLTCIGTGLGIMYLLLKEDEDNLNELPQQTTKRRRTFTEVKIAKDMVGYLIGRSGINIKEIQEKTATRITFKDEVASDEFRICVIRGLPANVQRGEYMVKEFLAKHVIQTVELIIPSNACGLIIGKGGSTIRTLQKTSGAKITVDSADFGIKGHQVTIKGTPEEVKKAKALIEEKIELDGLGTGFQNRKPINSYETLDSSNKETLLCGEDFVEVTVTSIVSPGNFYLQLAGENQDKLLKLEVNLNEFYLDAENLVDLKVETAEIGKLVASIFSNGHWYRGAVIKMRNDGSEVKVFYVDYGDYEWKKLSEVFVLVPKFHELKHQAISCSLDGVEKTEPKWTPEAIDFFEKATYDQENKKMLLAKVQGFSEKSRHGYIPSIILKDANGIEDKIIADELVACGFGKALVPSIIPNLVPAGEEEDWN